MDNKQLKIYTCDDHQGLYPVPTASIVIAESKEEARKMLYTELKNTINIEDNDFTLKEVDLSKKDTIILSNGNY